MSHARLPPSSADKWMVCTDWLNATADRPNVTSVYAEEGTEAHSVLEICVRLDMPPHEVIGDRKDDGMVDAVAAALDWLRDYCEETGAAVWPEVQLAWGEVIGYPELFGHSDLVLVSPEEIAIADYKHGQGVVVDPATSKQLRLYLAGAIKRFGKRKRYRLVIIQPRARGFDPVREHVVPEAELKEFLREAKRAAQENYSGQGTRQAGDHCRFCTAAAVCPTLADYTIALAVAEFEEAGGDDSEGLGLGV